jgi:hypothetical protein
MDLPSLPSLARHNRRTADGPASVFGGRSTLCLPTVPGLLRDCAGVRRTGLLAGIDVWDTDRGGLSADVWGALAGEGRSMSKERKIEIYCTCGKSCCLYSSGRFGNAIASDAVDEFRRVHAGDGHLVMNLQEKHQWEYEQAMVGNWEAVKA